MLALLVWPKVITLSGFYYIVKIQLIWNRIALFLPCTFALCVIFGCWNWPVNALTWRMTKKGNNQPLTSFTHYWVVLLAFVLLATVIYLTWVWLCQYFLRNPLTFFSLSFFSNLCFSQVSNFCTNQFYDDNLIKRNWYFNELSIRLNFKTKKMCTLSVNI